MASPPGVRLSPLSRPADRPHEPGASTSALSQLRSFGIGDAGCFHCGAPFMPVTRATIRSRRCSRSAKPSGAASNERARTDELNSSCFASSRHSAVRHRCRRVRCVSQRAATCSRSARSHAALRALRFTLRADRLRTVSARQFREHPFRSGEGVDGLVEPLATRSARPAHRQGVHFACMTALPLTGPLRRKAPAVIVRQPALNRRQRLAAFAAQELPLPRSREASQSPKHAWRDNQPAVRSFSRLR
jgi:hypothetical protein